MFGDKEPSLPRTERWIVSLALFPLTWAFVVFYPRRTFQEAVLASPRHTDRDYTPPVLFGALNALSAVVSLLLLAEPSSVGDPRDASYAVVIPWALASLVGGNTLLLGLLALAFRLRTKLQVRRGFHVIAYASALYLPGVHLRDALAGSPLWMERLWRAVTTGELSAMLILPPWAWLLMVALAGVFLFWIALLVSGLATVVPGKLRLAGSAFRVCVALSAVFALQMALCYICMRAPILRLVRAMDRYESLEHAPQTVIDVELCRPLEVFARNIATHEAFTPAQRYGAQRRATVLAVARWEAVHDLLRLASDDGTDRSPSLAVALYNTADHPEAYESLLERSITFLREHESTFPHGKALTQQCEQDLRRLRELRRLPTFAADRPPGAAEPLHVSLAVYLRNPPLVLWPYAPTTVVRCTYSFGLSDKSHGGGSVQRAVWTTQDPTRTLLALDATAATDSVPGDP